MNNPAAASGFPPPQFSEVILKTSRFAELLAWYENLLQLKAFFLRNDAKQASWTGAWNIAFIRLYHQHTTTAPAPASITVIPTATSLNCQR